MAIYVVGVLKVAVSLIGIAATLCLTATHSGAAAEPSVHVIPIAYRAHDGLMRRAYVIVPADYRPGTATPLVISPQGRGVRARRNGGPWGRRQALGDVR